MEEEGDVLHLSVELVLATTDNTIHTLGVSFYCLTIHEEHEKEVRTGWEPFRLVYALAWSWK